MYGQRVQAAIRRLPRRFTAQEAVALGQPHSAGLGLYIIERRQQPIYVGKTERQGFAKRVRQTMAAHGWPLDRSEYTVRLGMVGRPQLGTASSTPSSTS